MTVREAHTYTRQAVAMEYSGCWGAVGGLVQGPSGVDLFSRASEGSRPVPWPTCFLAAEGSGLPVAPARGSKGECGQCPLPGPPQSQGPLQPSLPTSPAAHSLPGCSPFPAQGVPMFPPRRLLLSHVIEIKFTYHMTHPFEVYDSVVFSQFAELCNRHH